MDPEKAKLEEEEQENSTGDRGCCCHCLCVTLKVFICIILTPIFLALGIVYAIVLIITYPGRCCSPCCIPCIEGLTRLLKWLAELPLQIMRWVCHRGTEDDETEVTGHEAEEETPTANSDQQGYGT